MYQEEFMAVGQASIGKVNFLRKNPVGYFLASMLAEFMWDLVSY